MKNYKKIMSMSVEQMLKMLSKSNGADLFGYDQVAAMLCGMSDCSECVAYDLCDEDTGPIWSGFINWLEMEAEE